MTLNLLSIRRFYAPHAVKILAEKSTASRLAQSLAPLLAEKQNTLSRLKVNETPISNITAKAVVGGMRGLPLLVCETSTVDAKKGIQMRQTPLSDMLQDLPREGNSNAPLCEGLLWFLFTGKMPSTDELAYMKHELSGASRRSLIPDSVFDAINALPETMHPMVQFVVGVMSCEILSKFAYQYDQGKMPKGEFWKVQLDDWLNLIAKLPSLAAYIYARAFCRERIKEVLDLICYRNICKDLDWGARLAHLLGLKDPIAVDLVRLYLVLHADHEGGNVSAHTAYLVSSALSSPYLAFGSAMCGLAGPLHGLAAQASLQWLAELREFVRASGFDDKIPSVEKADKRIQDIVNDFARKKLATGQVIPGYGHAVLRDVDVRYTAFEAFTKKHSIFTDSDLVNLVHIVRCVVPKILQETGKVSNPWPNVDAHSGAALHAIGLTHPEYFTVMFGISRALGLAANCVWARALGMPIERPRSVSLDALMKMAGSAT